MDNTRSSRILALDGARGLAIAAVIIHHYFHAPYLWMGVDLFFILSGFLITSILLKERQMRFSSYIGHFYERRLRRIVPAYVLILVLACIVYTPAFMRHTWWMYIGLMNFLKPLGLYELTTLPLWSLAVEEQFYLFWPLVIYRASEDTIKRVCVVLMILAPFFRLIAEPYVNQWAIYMLLPFRMDSLALGALFAMLWPRFKGDATLLAQARHVSMRLVPLVGAACIAIILLFARKGITVYQTSPLGEALLYECTLLLAAGVFVWSMLGVAKPVFEWAPLRWLATLSYTVYLCHLVFLNMMKQVVPTYAAIPLGLLCTFAYASASWFLIERPLLRQGHSDVRVVTKTVQQ